MRITKNRIIKLVYIIAIPLIITIFVVILTFITRWNNLSHYGAGIDNFNQEKYQDAKTQFEEIRQFKLAGVYLEVIEDIEHVQNAANYNDDEEYENAYLELEEIDESKLKRNTEAIDDSYTIDLYFEVSYNTAIGLFENGQFEDAGELFTTLGNYKDSIFYVNRIDVKVLQEKQNELYLSAKVKYNDEQYKEALEAFSMLKDYEDSSEWIKKCETEIRKRNLNHIVAGGVQNSVAIGEGGNVLYTNTYLSGMKECDDWENIVSVDTYGQLTVGLTSEKTVTVCGEYGNKKRIDPSSWKDIIDIAAGEQFVLALDEAGNVHGAGHNGDGQCNVGEWRDVIDIDAGWRFSVGLTKEGRLLFAGQDAGQEEEFSLESEEWRDVIQISASGGGETAVKPKGSNRGNGHTVGLRKDGTVVAIGDNKYGQCDVDDWRDIVRVATGDWYTVGLKADGSIVITGQNEPGYQYIDSEIISSLPDIIDIAAGYGQTLCLLQDGTVRAFGFDDAGKCEKVKGWKKSQSLDIITGNSQWAN